MQTPKHAIQRGQGDEEPECCCLTGQSSKYSGRHLKLALLSVFPEGPVGERVLLLQQEGLGGQQAELPNKNRESIPFYLSDPL